MKRAFPTTINTRALKRQPVAPEEIVMADDLKPQEVAVACERWHNGDPLAALAAAVGTSAKQLAIAFLLAGFTPDRVGVGKRTGRWGRIPPELAPAFVEKGKFDYSARPLRPMTTYQLYGEDAEPFTEDDIVTKVDDLHRCSMPLEYILALTGANEVLVRERVAVLKRQNVRHALMSVAEFATDPLDLGGSTTVRAASVEG